MKSFLSGKKDLGSVSLMACAPALPKSAAASTRPHAVTGKASSPTIDVVKEGDKVVRLVITCACGERMEVECLYPAGG